MLLEKSLGTCLQEIADAVRTSCACSSPPLVQDPAGPKKKMHILTYSRNPPHVIVSDIDRILYTAKCNKYALFGVVEEKSIVAQTGIFVQESCSGTSVSPHS